MENTRLYHIISGKHKRIWHVVYWAAAAFLMFFVFSNRNYDVGLRMVLVSFLIVVSYFTVVAINQYLIPRLLFQDRVFRFIYALFAVFIFTLWLITFSIILLILYSLAYLPDAVLPRRVDVIILISGNYLIVILAAVIHFIRESYRRLIERNQMEKQKQETELKLKEAQLKLLQGQIHPHFLFNMLNNLYAMVRDSTHRSRKLIIKLSQLLDYMLYECNREQVSLQQEIRFIQNYIELERIRHDKEFNVTTRLPENTENIHVAPLIFFPFVENAFKHGFRRPEGNFVVIAMEIKSAYLHFKVENSISKDRDDRFLKQEGHGIGLKNIRERLNLIYNQCHSLNIQENEATYKIQLTLKYQ